MLLPAMLILTVISSLHGLKASSKTTIIEQPAPLLLSSQARQHSKVKVIMLHIGDHEEINNIAKMIHFDLGFSDQMAVDLKKTATVPTEKQAAALAKQAYTLMLTVEEKGTKRKTTDIEITLKDPINNQTFFSKNYSCPPHNLIQQGHQIADDLMPVLTGETGPMLSTLAYCKQVSPTQKYICIADYACRLEKPVVTAKTINVAPAWHPKAPGLCYSQFTRHNSRLMFVDLNTQKHNIVCSYDGLNMQPSFSSDGVQAALCLSGKGNSEIYLYDQQVCKSLGKKTFKQLTNNKGNNVSPCLLPSGDLVFCSDFQTGSPQLYLKNAATGVIKRLTNGKGYCASPNYNNTTKQIVYTRYAHGAFQLWSLDLSSPHPHEKQLTFNAGDKLEPAWSACGKYVAFTYAKYDQKLKKRTSQIGIFNTQSSNIRIMTSGPELKSFPCWTSRNLYA
jgi:tol-pal system beta propeller repeat protein TolB